MRDERFLTTRLGVRTKVAVRFALGEMRARNKFQAKLSPHVKFRNVAIPL